MSLLFETRFPSGRVVITPGASDLLEETGHNPLEFLEKHLNRDWGEVSEDDAITNDLALVRGTRILSAYTIKNGGKIWIITEADRSVTTILLPEEY